MNNYHKLSLTCFILGIVFFIAGILTGDVEAGFLLIFPFLIGSGIFAFLGFICLFIAVLLFMFGFVSSASESIDQQLKESDFDVQKKKPVKGGGIILIGPIPIVFGSNWKIAILMMILAMILIITIVFYL